MQRRRSGPTAAATRLAEGPDAQEAGDPAAAGRVGLEHVDGAGLEHPAEIGQVVAVLAGGDVHAGRAAVAEQPQPVEVVGGDRLLEPGHPQLGEPLGRARACLRL